MLWQMTMVNRPDIDGSAGGVDAGPGRLTGDDLGGGAREKVDLAGLAVRSSLVRSRLVKERLQIHFPGDALILFEADMKAEDLLGG